jgi:OOP family OmpA-OmpF porin
MITKKAFLISFIAIATMSTTGYAGDSKMVAPVESAVVPVAELPTGIFYSGLGLTMGKYKCPLGGCSYEDTTSGVMARLGYDYNKYIGIEARAISTFAGEDKLAGQKLQHVGIFLKPMYPFGDKTSVYALLGYGKTKTNSSGNSLSEYDGSGFSAGLGLEYGITEEYSAKYGKNKKKWGVFVDYQRLIVKDKAPDMDVISTGVRYSF